MERGRHIARRQLKDGKVPQVHQDRVRNELNATSEDLATIKREQSGSGNATVIGPWSLQNLAASSSDALSLVGTSGVNVLYYPWAAGEIVAVSAILDIPPTAGDLRFVITIDGTVAWSHSFAVGDTQWIEDLPASRLKFRLGASIGVAYEADGSFAPSGVMDAMAHLGVRA